MKHSRSATGPRSTTRIGARATRGLQPRLAAQRRRVGGPDGVSGLRATAASRTIVAATAARASRGTATTWTRMPTISRRSSQRWTCETRSTSATRPAAARSRDTSAATAAARRQGRAHRRGAAADAEDRRQSRRPADGGVRRHPRRRAGRPVAVLQGPDRAVLRRQPSRRQGVAGAARFVLAAGHAGRASRASSTASRRSRKPTSPRT